MLTGDLSYILVHDSLLQFLGLFLAWNHCSNHELSWIRTYISITWKEVRHREKEDVLSSYHTSRNIREKEKSSIRKKL